MNNSELLQKIDLLIDQGNMVWESPGSKANQDISRFCGEVKGLVHEIYGADHPYLKKNTDQTEGLLNDLGEGMSVLKSIRVEIESSSPL
jgi:hypothetical protein